MDDNNIDKLASSFNNLFSRALDIARDLELIEEGEPIIIPDLYISSRDVCSSIYKDVVDFFEHDDEKTSFEVIQKTIGRFCLCAGMGAVELWCVNYDLVKDKGLYTLLTEERGIYEMDEYVYNLVGLQMNSSKCKELISKSFLLFDLVLNKSFDLMNELFQDFKDKPERYLSFMLMEDYRIMFKIGVTLQAHTRFNLGLPQKSKKNRLVSGAFIKSIYDQMKTMVNKSIRPDFLSGYTSTLANSLFAIFEELHIKSGYVFDVFEYQDEFPDSDNHMSMIVSSSQKHIYVHQINAQKKYSPTVDESFTDELYNMYPDTYQLLNTNFCDDMKIMETLYTKDSIKNIPDPTSYIECDFSVKSAWEFFLFDTFVSQSIWPIIFSYEQFHAEFSEYYQPNSYAQIQKEDDDRLRKMDLSPRVEIIDSVVHVQCYQVRIGAIVKLHEILEYGDSKYTKIKCDEEVIISFKFSERMHISFKRYPYWY